jgi:hypothetical protein
VILIVAVMASVLVALLRGGKLALLGQLKIQSAWLIPLAFLMQVFVVFVPGGRTTGLSDPAAVLTLISYMVLVVAVIINRRLPGMALIGMGLLVNFAVIAANGGFMPIESHVVELLGHGDRVQALEPGYRVYQAKDVILRREDTRLWILSDILVIPPPFPLSSALSLGDVMLIAGLFVLIQRTMVEPSGKELTHAS